MTITIYHNPRCSKSRQTLELIEAGGIKPNIVHYLDDPPDVATLRRLAALLKVPLADILRKNEPDFEAADTPSLDDEIALASWVTQHPRVLQRPIVVDEESDAAVIGRPPENVLRLLRDD